MTTLNRHDAVRDRPTSSWARRGAARLLALLVQLWLWTLRLEVVDRTGTAVDRARGNPTRPWVLVFFHGTQMALLAWPRRRRTAVLVSWSTDGEWQSAVMRRAGMIVVRGSSSRGGVRGLAALVRLVRGTTGSPSTATSRNDGIDAAFAVDGPRGPFGAVHGGASLCARRLGALIVPIGSAASPATVLPRTWDRFVVPWPFARTVVVLGAPLPAASEGSEIASAIACANDQAALMLARRKKADALRT